ncbi:MAG: LamG domain-containing protein, partial [Nitrososphaeraceae archaeon]|nr:LamG domain-containing protein [Nitrososphaeraceae archaeon]
NVYIEEDIGLVLDGDGYVTNDGNSTSNISNLTLTAWVKPYYANGSAELTVVSKEKTFELIINNVVDPQRVASFSVFDGIKRHTVISSTVFGENWSHIAVSYNGTMLSMYTNGTLSNEKIVTDTIEITSNGKLEPKTSELLTSSSDVVIGAKLDNTRSTDDVSKKFSGEIYDVNIFDVYLTAKQILEIYNRSFPIIFNVTNSTLTNSTQIDSLEEISLEKLDTINVLEDISVMKNDNVTSTDNLSNFTAKNNTGLDLNGTESYVTIEEEKLNAELNQLTISASINPNYTSGSAEFAIVSKEKSFILSLNNIISPEHVPKFSIFDFISWIDVVGKSKIEKLSNLVAVIDDTTISLYLNSTLIGSTQIPKSIYFHGDKVLFKNSDVMVTNSDLILGAYINTLRGETKLSNHFSGYIDDVHIYKEALDESQIQEIYLKFLKKFKNLKDRSECEDDDRKYKHNDRECDDEREECEDDDLKDGDNCKSINHEIKLSEKLKLKDSLR